jgi:hypothetical protein
VKAPLRRILAAAAALAATGTLASTASPAAGTTATCPGGFAYAGLWSERATATAAAATLTPLAPARVDAGHVAAWVNVGDARSTAWLQVGLNSTPGSPAKLYYELMAPGATDTTYVQLRDDVPVGESHRVGIAEVKGKPSWWRVTVDGVPAAPDVYLPGSHGKWHFSVSGESFRPTDGPCNFYSYGLSAVKVAAAGARANDVLFDVADPGYHLARTTAAASYSVTGHD